MALFDPGWVVRALANNCEEYRKTAFSSLRSFRLQKLVLLALCVCASLGARAQDFASTLSSQAQSPFGSRTEHAGFALAPWQIAVGYQYDRLSFRGTLSPFSTNGGNISATRYLGRMFGIEAALAGGFGHAEPGVSTWSIAAMAGPRIAYRTRGRFEPWVHGLVGAVHFNFGGLQFPGSTTSAARVGGGGLDYRVNSSLSLKVQADYLGTLLAGVPQRNVQFVTGLAWNF
jgi:hypothetical protein